MNNDFIVNNCFNCDQFEWEPVEMIQPANYDKIYPVYKTVDVPWCNMVNKNCTEVAQCPKEWI